MTKEALEKAKLLSGKIEAIELTIPDLEKYGIAVKVHNGSAIPKFLIGDVGNEALTELAIAFLKKQLDKLKTEFNSL